MRLLQRSDAGGYHLTETFTSEEAIPPYAILSHTWGADDDEVTFDDLKSSIGAYTNKPGYEKIRFCAEKARQDGLDHFWIDTCCINKANKAEMSYSINSMYNWYRNADRCYVYLSDVSTAKRKANSDTCEWEPAFRESRWFTRAWTLQELLASPSIQFFSHQGKRLGDKYSLGQQIHEITAIPDAALRGELLSQFSVNDRLSWIEHRQSKLEEDKAYSLLGIFGVYIPPIYGEGIGAAFKRLQDEIGKLEKCTQDLHLTDPRRDKARIEETKGGLLEDCYHWILENPDFQRWRDNRQSRLLWIKGDPGKGKTMLLCGIIKELEKSMAKTAILSYFFCQATDSRINDATAVLRGLIYLLVYQQPSLVAHVRKKYDRAGKALFEDANAWVALSEIFTNVVQDPSLKSVYLVIDALDECVTDLPKLLDFIVQTSSVSSRVKWIMSSRNWPDIEERLEQAGDKVRLSLELNADFVSVAVRSYVRHKVSLLAKTKKYSDQIRDTVLDYLYANANDTFLWVALVCQNLEKISRVNIVTKLKAFLPGLKALYERMLQHIMSSSDADLCGRVLAIVTIVYRPISLLELTALVEELDDMTDDLEAIQEVVSFCGSLLTIRDGIIYFVHQSAKDFLLKEAIHIVFPSGSEAVHYAIFSRSLLAMSSTLRRDIYGLGALGYPIDQVQQPEPDPLASLRYSCIYWVDHLHDCNLDLTTNAQQHLREEVTIDVFLSTRYLYWLEALSLCRCISSGVASMAKLRDLVQAGTNTFASNKLVYDAYRFILYHKVPIESFPLQTYASALLFSPSQSLIRRLFNQEAPDWVTVLPDMRDDWDACLQTLEGHTGGVKSVVSSRDSKLASNSYNEVKIWDAISGQCLQTFEVNNHIHSIAISHHSKRVAAVSQNGTVHIWDVIDGKCLLVHALPGPPKYHYMGCDNRIEFSPNTAQLASTWGPELGIWDVSKGKYLQLSESRNAYYNGVVSVAYSCDSKRLASVSTSGSVNIWDADSGMCLRTLKLDGYVGQAAFFKNLTWIISTSRDSITIWDGNSGERLKKFNHHASSFALSHDLKRLASGSTESGSTESTVKIWDTDSGECLQIFKGHQDTITSLSFSGDSKHLASASDDRTLKIWDLCQSGKVSQRHDDDMVYSSQDNTMSMAVSYDATQLVLLKEDSKLEVWGVQNVKCRHTLQSYPSYFHLFAISHDSKQLAAASADGTLQLWDLGSGECLQKFPRHGGSIISIAFSLDSTLASASGDRSCMIWDMNTGDCLRIFKKSHGQSYNLGNFIALSHDSTQLAVVSGDSTIEIWDTRNGESIFELEVPPAVPRVKIASLAYSKTSRLLASATTACVVQVWDMNNGQNLHTFQCDEQISSMFFDITALYLHTNHGLIDIHASSLATDQTQSDVGLPRAQYRDLACTGWWISYKSENLVWIPTEFRHRNGRVALAKNVIGVLDESRRWWMYKFDLERLSAAQ
ncbi:WD40 repeat-like protein [Polyplosphaeria fusca]|uniref:Mitochondrial division protein 1 n=1 Tax=Polyplosphaeria fusca TaxID=682080 RepID=A0A9P4UYZ4_9PLEO|nr:WD40 repeat-like protein [Polyplosphaeria fusca]